MAITEEARHRLYQRLEGVLGVEEATILMEHLPPVGWADVTTKRDLDHLAAATKGDIAQLAAATKGDIAQLAAATKSDIVHLGDTLRIELHRELRLQLLATMGYMTALISGLFAALKLT